jgi:hypothetical protein
VTGRAGVTRAERLGRIAVPLIALMPLLALYAVAFPHPPYSTDSWSYVELSRTVFGDFYHVATLRAFDRMLDHSAAFPPLWPVAIATADAATGAGVYGGYVLTFIAFAAFAYLSEAIGRRVFDTRWVGLAAALILTTQAGFLSELLGARSIPLALTILAAIAHVYTRPGEIDGRRAALLGGLGGLAVLNRFDALPVAVAVGVIVLVDTRWRVRTASCYGAALLVALLPWIVYSLAVLDVPFATDNRATALALDPHAFVTDWYPVPQAQFADDPGAWLAKVAAHVPPLIGALAASVVGWTLLLPIAGLLATATAVLGRGRTSCEAAPLLTEPRRRLLAIGLALVANLPSYAITGYFDDRYFAPIIWWLNLLGIGFAVRLFPRAQPIAAGSLVLNGCVALAVAMGLSAQSAAPWRPVPAADFVRSPYASPIAACGLDRDAGRILFLGKSGPAAQFGALTGVKAAIEPKTIATGRLGEDGIRQFLNTFAIGYVFVPEPLRTETVLSRFPIEPMACSASLFRVDGSVRADAAPAQRPIP